MKPDLNLPYSRAKYQHTYVKKNGKPCHCYSEEPEDEEQPYNVIGFVENGQLYYFPKEQTH